MLPSVQTLGVVLRGERGWAASAAFCTSPRLRGSAPPTVAPPCSGGGAAASTPASPLQSAPAVPGRCSVMLCFPAPHLVANGETCIRTMKPPALDLVPEDLLPVAVQDTPSAWSAYPSWHQQVRPASASSLQYCSQPPLSFGQISWLFLSEGRGRGRQGAPVRASRPGPGAVFCTKVAPSFRLQG